MARSTKTNFKLDRQGVDFALVLWYSENFLPLLERNCRKIQMRIPYTTIKFNQLREDPMYYIINYYLCIACY
jgi:hypothetical protein